MTKEALKLALEALDVAQSLLEKSRHHGKILAAYDTIKEALAQPEQEPLAFAGIEMWIGNTRIKKLMTQTELHSAIDPWAIVKFNSDSCIDALKEKNT
jgi:hypothetical protein